MVTSLNLKKGSVNMYLDPAFGGMFLQVILALIVVGGAMIFVMRRKVRELFTKNKDDIYNEQPTMNSGASEDGVVDVLADQ